MNVHLFIYLLLNFTILHLDTQYYKIQIPIMSKIMVGVL